MNQAHLRIGCEKCRSVTKHDYPSVSWGSWGYTVRSWSGSGNQKTSSSISRSANERAESKDQYSSMSSSIKGWSISISGCGDVF
jgi:hypothetical protein